MAAGRLYVAEIEVIPSTLTSGTTYWAMRFVSGTGKVRVRRIYFNATFAGAAANTRSVFEVERFSAATPTAGNAITAVPLAGIGSIAPTLVTDIRQANGGLTTTSVVFEAPFCNAPMTSQPAAGAQLFDYNPLDRDDYVELLSGDGLCVRANGAIITASGIHGRVLFEEVPG